MIKLCYEELSQVSFQMAVGKLAQTKMNKPEAFRVAHILSALENERKQMHELFKKEILAKYAKGGLTAEPPTGKSLEMGLPFTALDGQEDAAKTAMENFSKREFTVPHKKVSGEFLFSVSEWTPQELIALQPIVTEITVAS